MGGTLSPSHHRRAADFQAGIQRGGPCQGSTPRPEESPLGTRDSGASSRGRAEETGLGTLLIIKPLVTEWPGAVPSASCQQPWLQLGRDKPAGGTLYLQPQVLRGDGPDSYCCQLWEEVQGEGELTEDPSHCRDTIKQAQRPEGKETESNICDLKKPKQNRIFLSQPHDFWYPIQFLHVCS